MKRSELLEMPLSELRTIAKNAEISAERTWKKDDFVKMILKAEKAAQKKKAKKAKKSAEKNTAAKKITEKKSIDKKPSVKKAAQKKAATKKPIKKSVAKKLSVTETGTKKPVKPAPKKETAAQKHSADIALLTVAELKLIAKECGIKLQKSFIKTDIIKAITKIQAQKNANRTKSQITKPKESTVITGKASDINLDAYRPALYRDLLSPAMRKSALPHLPDTGTKNSLTTMAVNQSQLFVFWDIVENVSGSLNLRVIDTSTGAFFYVPVWSRTAEQIVSVRPGCMYAVEIGAISGSGRFRKLATAKTPKTPAESVKIDDLKERAKLPAKFFRTPLPKGSY
ncbi:MAG: hypothetical protein LLF86_04865 [Nitrospiraceae bacterium]|nr:hypothetical protein [Nitrospiraceae bacterium]